MTRLFFRVAYAVQEGENAFIFMADVWRPEKPSDARYIWLPIQFKTDGTPFIEWIDNWTLDFFDQTDASKH